MRAIRKRNQKLKRVRRIRDWGEISEGWDDFIDPPELPNNDPTDTVDSAGKVD